MTQLEILRLQRQYPEIRAERRNRGIPGLTSIVGYVVLLICDIEIGVEGDSEPAAWETFSKYTTSPFMLHKIEEIIKQRGYRYYNNTSDGADHEFIKWMHDSNYEKLVQGPGGVWFYHSISNVDAPLPMTQLYDKWWVDVLKYPIKINYHPALEEGLVPKVGQPYPIKYKLTTIRR